MQRKTLVYFLCFFLGAASGYGLFYLDQQSSAPRLESTETFEVTLPDGTTQHLSYAEMERARQEMRQRIASLERKLAEVTPASIKKPSLKSESLGSVQKAVRGKEAADKSDEHRHGTSRKNLGELFAKIFSQPVMEEIVLSQVKREAGEISDVLSLSETQRKSLEDSLKKRKKARFGRRGMLAASGTPEDRAASEKSLEEELQSILTPEQARQYEEYKEKKEALAGTSQVDRDLFELTWRLDLNEEQEGQARQVLQEHWDGMQTLSPASGPAGADDEESYMKRFDLYLKERDGLNSRTAQKMKAVLDEDQYNSFLAYQQEKDVETQLVRKLIQTAKEEEKAPAP